MKKEKTMNLKAKLAIFLVAILLTFLGFNLIASSGAVDLMKVGKRAGHQIIVTVLANSDTASHHSPNIKG